MRISYVLAAILIIVLLLSCATVTGRYVAKTKLIEKEGKAGKQNIAVLTLKKTGDEGIVAAFTSPLFPAVTIYGDIDEEGNGFVFYITGARLFAYWPNGWTEGFYEASGKLVFGNKEGQASCSIEDPFELWDITEGELRYYDAFYRQEDGLWKVKSRVDRIIEVSRFLKGKQFPPLFGDMKRKTIYGPGFSTAAGSFLFPEMTGFSKMEKEGKLPEDFYSNKREIKPERVSGSDLWWRTDYTKAIFPENLWQLRDSGTLWRDYEEAPLLFLSLYNIDYFFNSLLKDELFIKK